MIAMAMAQQVDLLAIVIKPIQAQYKYLDSNNLWICLSRATDKFIFGQ